ncbi:exonuclease V a 5' deoxyribonuclease-domain-containing protein [Chiua virens]|nr:exonuclease V a 5' deoxyribonuclease-domain-containing protein [Chiua virens]
MFPSRCEVQYEYSLYGKRHKPLHQRPTSFTSKSGKQIRVHQQVAQANDRTLKRGKSVHKALEDELYPEKVVVHPVSAEDRFGLRILQLIDGFNQLTIDGIARELPVFTITHAQVVFGVIDEVLCLPISRQGQHHASSGSPPLKKQRLTSPLSTDPSDNNGLQTEPTETLSSSAETIYELHIVDYKTRQVSTIPPDQDTLSPRLQLMMYHRMLSCLLEPNTFDFDLLWNRLKLDPTKPFSTKFLKDIAWQQRQADFNDGPVHLNRLVSDWISTVQRKRLAIRGVSQQLKLVYRRSVFAQTRDKGKQKATEIADIEDIEDPTAALLLQEELDLARAIQESISEIKHRQVGQTAYYAAQNTEQNANSSGGSTSDLISPLRAEQTDPTPDLETLLVRSTDEISSGTAENRQHQAELGGNSCSSSSDHPSLREVIMPQGTSIGETSRIIGTKEFDMDEGKLDAHLVDVLQWWFVLDALFVEMETEDDLATANIRIRASGENGKREKLWSGEGTTLKSCFVIPMDGWVDYLHLDFLGEHILFSFLRLQSIWSFILSSILIAIICLSERFLTLILNKNISPSTLRYSRLATAAWKSSLYGSVTLLRLLYMLIAMSNQLGCVSSSNVITLSIGQFAIEYIDYQEPNSDRHVEEPLLGTSYEPFRRRHTNPRVRSKPDNIFIHPNENNLARADAVALQLGLAGDTELVQGNNLRADGHSWQLGKGKELARETFGATHRRSQSDTNTLDEDEDDSP